MDNNIVEGEVVSSPVVKNIKEKEGMTFPEAIKELTAGKHITRLEWDNSDYGLLMDGLLMIYVSGVLHKWIVNDGDLLAEDWIIVRNAN